MANSQFEYVRNFEHNDPILPNTWVAVRLDGRAFHKFTKKHGFEKPNDRRALDLMNAAAEAVMRDLMDIIIAYGHSDEYSFVFHRTTMIFDRRASKLCSTVLSIFTAAYVHLWPSFFPAAKLELHALPTFDARAIAYPAIENLRDYLSWRQVDCHVNNLYNTTFWAMVNRGGMTRTEAEEALKGTVSSDKNEILFSRFGINYNNEPQIFKKGSVVYRDLSETSTKATDMSATASSTSSNSQHRHQREKQTESSSDNQSASRPAKSSSHLSGQLSPILPHAPALPHPPTSASPTKTRLSIPSVSSSSSKQRKRSAPTNLYLSPSALSAPTGRPPTPGTPKAFPSLDSPAEAPSPISESGFKESTSPISPASTVLPVKEVVTRSASIQGLVGTAQSPTLASRAKSRERDKRPARDDDSKQEIDDVTPTPSRPTTQEGPQGRGSGAKRKQKHKEPDPQSHTQLEKQKKRRTKARIVVEHVDIIRDEFWEARPWILA